MVRAREQDGKFSAEVAAYARAVGRLDPGIENPDHLAERLLNFRFKVLLLPGLRHLARVAYERRVPGMYRYLQARTKRIDELLLSDLDKVRQIVLLGAGLDTRPYRLAHRLSGVRIFEVDHPGTGAWKQDRLHRLGCPTNHVSYVAVDFNTDSWEEKLQQAGYDAGANTFFLWEGVMMYLPKNSVEQTLGFFSQAAVGSSFAFDYVYRSSLERPADYLGAEKYYRYMAKRGEPCLFGVDSEEVSPLLAGFGLSLASNTGPKELSRLVSPGPLCDFLGIVHGRRGQPPAEG